MDVAIRNDILRALLSSEYQHLRPKLEQVDLRFGDVLYATDQRIHHVYFPETAVVAMIDTVEDGGTVEVGIIGREGMQVLLAVISQSVACSQHHSVTQRLARWLLATSDRAGSNEFEMSTSRLPRCSGCVEKVLPRPPSSSRPLD